MLQYFYLLICIPLCFCYEYTEEGQQLRKKNGNSETKKAKHEKNNMIQFDVASFLKNFAGKNSQDYEPFAYNKIRDKHTQSDFYYESPLNENIEKRDENTNDLNIDSDLSRKKDEDPFDPDSQAFGEIAKNEEPISNRAIKIKNKQNDWQDDRNLVHPEKKCAFRDMKVPFFFRKPSTAKKQKRTFFCTSCSKPYTSGDRNSNSNSKNNCVKTKRAFGNLCPKCIKELLKRRKKEPQKSKQIHCSREFYQNVVTVPENKQNEKLPFANSNNNFEDYSNSLKLNRRLKRNDNEERERQLKELAEVEKKVDHVQVTTPKFNTVPY